MKANRLSVLTTFIIIVLMLLLPLVFSARTAAQDQPQIMWQAGNAGPTAVFSSDGQWLLTGTKLWGVADGRLLHDFTLPYNGSGVNTSALSPDGKYAAMGIQAYNQNLDVFTVSDGVLIGGRITAHNNGTAALAFSPDSQLLASGGWDGTAKIWHLPDMTLLRTINSGVGYRPRVLALAFLDYGQTLALGGQGGVSLFRIADGALVQTLTGVATRSLAVSPDQQTLASGSNAIDQYGQCTDCSIKLWRVTDGALVGTLPGINDGVVSLAFSPDRQYITAGSGDRTYNGVVRFSRLADGALVKSFYQDPNNPGSYVTGVAFSPDGSVFAFAREDNVVVVAHNPLSSASSCAGTLSTTSQMFAASGGTGEINLSAPGGCDWAVTCSDNWFILTSASSGSGSGAINYEVRENFSSAARTGQINVGALSFTVMQAGQAASDCSCVVVPSFGTFTASGGNGTINVSAGAGCAWQAVSRVSWLTVTSSPGGVGTGTVSYTVAANTTGLTRKGKIVVGEQVFAIKQKAN